MVGRGVSEGMGLRGGGREGGGRHLEGVDEFLGGLLDHVCNLWLVCVSTTKEGEEEEAMVVEYTHHVVTNGGEEIGLPAAARGSFASAFQSLHSCRVASAVVVAAALIAGRGTG